jgi:hypothetical protein
LVSRNLNLLLEIDTQFHYQYGHEGIYAPADECVLENIWIKAPRRLTTLARLLAASTATVEPHRDCRDR